MIRKPSKQFNQFYFCNCHSLFPFFAASADLAVGVAFIMLRSNRESPLAVPGFDHNNTKTKQRRNNRVTLC